MDLTDTDFEKLLELARLKLSPESKIKLRRDINILVGKMIYIDNPDSPRLPGKNI